MQKTAYKMRISDWSSAVCSTDLVIRKLNADGKSHAALAYLDDYDRRFPDDQSARLLRADCLLGAGLLKQAEGIYLTLAQGADGAAAQAGLGKIAAARGDWAGAVHAYERAVAARTEEHTSELQSL